MRVGLTVDSLASTLTGIGRYTWELCQGLSTYPEVEDLGFFRFNEWISDPASFLDTHRSRRPYRPKWLKRWLMQRGFEDRLVHGTNYFLPDSVEKGVITVHDMSIYLHEATHPPERIAAFEKGFASSLARAAHIITDSETVRQELLQHQHSLSADQVTAIHLGVSPRYTPWTRAHYEPVIDRMLGQTSPYILCVATFEPRKRIEQAILAHAQLSEGYPVPPLVLVGARGWANDALHRLVERQMQRGAVIMLGQVAEEDLPFIYAGARLFIYPSIYEGFGLPPIEAMASGVPTIVSDRSCLPEVTKGAAMMCDPDDLDAFTEAIRRGLEDDNWRDISIDRGRQVAAGYTWEKCVENTVNVYRKVWADGG
ncbi:MULTISPECIES: glycosyltransferase family 4 protein [Sphingobium]|uniref:glycosyltransferase family 4 protein n=1 Tax=Sphingobium TaxID=165695 RepID=UPI0015EB5BE2|nr:MULTISPECIES: glycosyltransferase family 1 protein [Sphingobium]MCW2361390.1 alpha-1,3-rhamnosyl/mannosyltransferase [Sphingobium sp. B10D3B]MCW2401931.1 alpha-1,3-rhamnosyl/mannosyltransferase [Sphingobium sp. B10D7B]MCW2408910.1 alpha-1,3-rhamnosyl/mannosyltransferase [Sphingobium xanthum]